MQGLPDHAHKPTLEQLPRDMHVVANDAAAKVLARAAVLPLSCRTLGVGTSAWWRSSILQPVIQLTVVPSLPVLGLVTSPNRLAACPELQLNILAADWQVLSKLGYTRVTVVDHGETVTVADGRMTVTAFEGAPALAVRPNKCQ